MSYRFFALLLIVAFTGCTYPTFTNPIVEPKQAERFEELFGVYQATHPDSGEVCWLHIGRCDKNLPEGFHKFVWVSPPAPAGIEQGLTVGQYIGFIFKSGDSYVVQLPFMENIQDNQAEVVSEKWGHEKIVGYQLVRLKKLEKLLKLDFLEDEKVEELVNRKVLAGRIEQKVDETTDPPTVSRKDIIVTATTKELHKFFSEHEHDELFKSSGFVFSKADAGQ